VSELGKVSQWFIARRPSTRRLAQLYAALLYNANLKGFIRGELYTGQAKNLCVPGLNCYSCPGAVAACPLGALQNALGVSNHKAGWYIFGILLLFGVTLGRTVCGWMRTGAPAAAPASGSVKWTSGRSATGNASPAASV